MNLNISLANVAFYMFSGLAVVFAAMVAFGRNLIYSAFSLLGCFSGVAGIYILLSADFLGILQIFVYVGGITVLIIFAVMFTRGIGDVKITNQSMNWKSGALTVGVMFFLLYFLIQNTPWLKGETPSQMPTTRTIGDLLLSDYILPFELISLVLLIVLIGAIVVARKDDFRDQKNS